MCGGCWMIRLRRSALAAQLIGPFRSFGMQRLPQSACCSCLRHFWTGRMHTSCLQTARAARRTLCGRIGVEDEAKLTQKIGCLLYHRPCTEAAGVPAKAVKELKELATKTQEE